MQQENLKDYLAHVDREYNKSQEVLKMQQIGIILIFVAHATISDSTKEI